MADVADPEIAASFQCGVPEFCAMSWPVILSEAKDPCIVFAAHIPSLAVKATEELMPYLGHHTSS